MARDPFTRFSYIRPSIGIFHRLLDALHPAEDRPGDAVISRIGRHHLRDVAMVLIYYVGHVAIPFLELIPSVSANAMLGGSSSATEIMRVSSNPSTRADSNVPAAWRGPEAPHVPRQKRDRRGRRPAAGAAGGPPFGEPQAAGLPGECRRLVS